MIKKRNRGLLEVQGKNNKSRSIFIVSFGLLILAFLMMYSVFKDLGFSFNFFKEVLFNYNKSNPKHLIIYDLRLPRVLAASLVGASLAVSGTIMQSLTKNPLADPGIMGINAGSGLVLTICFSFFQKMTYDKLVVASFLGALLGAILVVSVSSTSRERGSMKIVLAGIAINTLLVGLSQGIALGFNVSQNVTLFTLGGLSGITMDKIIFIYPIILIALVFALLLSKSLSTLSLGDDVAKGLGLNTKLVYFLSSIVILVLSGTSVSLAGTLGFVGIIIPNISRKLVGIDYIKLVPVSAVLGSILLVLADIVSRMINPPFETPIGAVISVIGVPFFLYLTSKGEKDEKRK